jgi:hypothetical protein
MSGSDLALDSSAKPRHFRAQAGFINEDEARRIEIELFVEPVLVTFQEVVAFLLQCMCGLFLKVQPRFLSQTSSALRPIDAALSPASRRTISSRRTSFSYPGMHDPRSLLLCPHKTSDSAVAQIAKEVLSMTKINWNSTQMNQKLPLPIRAARVLKYVADGNVSSG